MPTLIQRIVLRLAATRAGSWFLSRTLERLDRAWLQRTSGKKTLTTDLTGLPVIQLTTRGAVSGRPRVCPLIPVRDGEKWVVFATNFGSKRHPAWYLNLRSDPEVEVAFDGVSGIYQARPAAEDERDRYWRQAAAVYPGYEAYKNRAGGRRIPIVVLEPKLEEIPRRSQTGTIRR
jgi:deazaflavin-dependent oxidoreductase (nitroreductase family)